MKVNFTKFKVFINIKRDYQEIDIREMLADLLYQNTSGIAGLELARKIYNSDGDLELTPHEVELIKSIYPLSKPLFIDSMEYYISNQKENDTTSK